MKKLALIFLLGIGSQQLYAQSEPETEPVEQTKPVKERKNEIGLFGQTSNGFDNDLTMAGVQYKKWVRPNMAIRALIAHGAHHSYDHSPGLINIIGDTVLTKNLNSRVNMVFIGGGVEAQRHFYKKIYLFAGLELRAGYGSGYMDTLYSKQYKEQGSSRYTTSVDGIRSSTPNINMTYVGFSPSIGAKFQWSRITLGAEIFPGEMAFNSRNVSGTTTSLMDLNTDLRQRVFLHFRF